MSSNIISRRELYAAGEPFGDSATRRKLGGGVVCGFGGSSKSSSASTTNNIDKRNAVQDGIGVSGDGNTVSITDSGLVSRALDSIDRADAINGEGFTQLLGVAGNLLTQTQSTMAKATNDVKDAYSQAVTDKAGALDNKTIAVIAVAGVAALAFARK